MLQLLKSNTRFKEGAYLFLLTMCCIGLSLFRVGYSGSIKYVFLNWNLFLAFVPWFLTSLIHVFPHWQERRSLLWFLGLSWLLFFPNAPYIFTDLFHLNSGSNMPIWFDLILILAFAWTGILFGFLSLWDFENLLSKRIHTKWIPYISLGLLFLSSFGVYLGRYLRWNSWDVLNKPGAILYDVGSRVVHPFEHPRTWGVTLFLGILLTLMYGSFRLVYARNRE
jgi:uncharacterized membrane protein